jgi:BASS family bile acid:Na+ symporter
VDTLIDVLILATLWAAGLGLGFGLQPGDLVLDRARALGFVRVLLLDVVVVPLGVWLLATAFSIPAGYATGLLIVAAASAGPLGIKAAQLAKGDQAFAVALVVVLELANILVVPVWATLLLPVGVTLPVDGIVRTLVIGILLPITLGVLIRRGSSSFAARLTGPTSALSTLGLGAVIVLIVARDARAVLDALATGLTTVTLLTLALTLVGGWLAGGPDRATRTTAAMVTSIRANAPALAVVIAAFGAAAQPPIAITVFGVLSVLVTVSVAAILGWWPTASLATIARTRARP